MNRKERLLQLKNRAAESRNSTYLDLEMNEPTTSKSKQRKPFLPSPQDLSTYNSTEDCLLISQAAGNSVFGMNFQRNGFERKANEFDRNAQPSPNKKPGKPTCSPGQAFLSRSNSEDPNNQNLENPSFFTTMPPPSTPGMQCDSSDNFLPLPSPASFTPQHTSLSGNRRISQSPALGYSPYTPGPQQSPYTPRGGRNFGKSPHYNRGRGSPYNSNFGNSPQNFTPRGRGRGRSGRYDSEGRGQSTSSKRIRHDAQGYFRPSFVEDPWANLMRQFEIET